MRRSVGVSLSTGLLALALLSGCASAAPDERAGTAVEGTPPTQSEVAAESPFQDGTQYAAVAVRAAVSVHETPGGPVVHSFDHPQASGAPLNFLIKGHEADWLEVYLPTRPNGSTGWIMAGAVEIQEVPFRLEVSTAENRMALYKGEELVREFTVATGTGGTPTPLGTFYLTELMAPTNEGYGPFAYGVSAYSEVLNDFGGGPGQIGVHGTDDESSIGTAASHGCIRLSNDDITELAGMLPLGTPIIVT